MLCDESGIGGSEVEVFYGLRNTPTPAGAEWVSLSGATRKRFSR